MPALPSLRRRPAPLRDQSLFRRVAPRPDPATSDRQLRLPLERAEPSAQVDDAAAVAALIAPDVPPTTGLMGLCAGLAALSAHGALVGVGLGATSISTLLAMVGAMAAAVGLPLLLMGPLLPVLTAVAGLRSPPAEVGSSVALGVQRAGAVAAAFGLPLALAAAAGAGEAVHLLVLPCMLVSGALGLGATLTRLEVLELHHDPEQFGATICARHALQLWAGATSLIATLSIARVVFGGLP